MSSNALADSALRIPWQAAAPRRCHWIPQGLFQPCIPLPAHHRGALPPRAEYRHCSVQAERGKSSRAGQEGTCSHRYSCGSCSFPPALIALASCAAGSNGLCTKPSADGLCPAGTAREQRQQPCPFPGAAAHLPALLPMHAGHVPRCKRCKLPEPAEKHSRLRRLFLLTGWRRGDRRTSAERRVAITLSCVIGPARVQSNFPPHICSVKSQVAPGFARLPTSRTCCWLGGMRRRAAAPSAAAARRGQACGQGLWAGSHKPLAASPRHHSSPLNSCSSPALAFSA